MTDEKLKELKGWLKDLVSQHEIHLMKHSFLSLNDIGQNNAYKAVLEKLEEIDK